jgi:CRISPR-associated protein Cst2
LSKEDKLESNSIPIEEKRERLILFFKALENIWGGGKQSRLLTDMSPKFLAITFQTAKSPIFLETLTVSENEELNDKAITEVIKGNNNILANYYLGVQSGIFKNNVSELLNADTIQDTFTNAIEYIKTIDF